MNEPAQNSPAYVVLGAAGGIGAETCRRLSAAGARLLLAGRPSDRLTALGEELGAPTHPLDATRTEEVEAAFKAAVDSFGPIAGAANFVGSLLLKPAHLTTDEEWDSVVATNLRSAFATVRAAAKTMRRSGGSVVLISSAAAQHGFANHEAIAAAKAGVNGLVLSAAATYAPYGLRFNGVAPGLTKTPLTESIWSKETSAAASLDLHAAGRLGEAGDVASAVVWLLDPPNNWITGEILAVDGGLARIRPTKRLGSN
ncbi:3-oxoacyl-[acyl-carrier-protein] reductase FabG [Pseudobythopirellula maris]|uniref:3-oxoacyl-[acyl-carrier-protein] reductase FabG n=1 Tax=Pseudobythopirellula maris TaxID=2527991 RepID=A0A5C5ZLH8_9BACT|nr:SDR family oxidoreductase [Pseudobythopirellula maris]TWT87681.1 3-oxoacyl-[acyl-carrier-protein] reductase FabG [Pseudobythopirellula maris]